MITHELPGAAQLPPNHHRSRRREQVDRGEDAVVRLLTSAAATGVAIWRVRRAVLVGLLFGILSPATPAWAQWQSQSFTLKPGWNAIFLHVDASHVLLEELTIAQSGNPIAEVWLWKPASSAAQFVTSPQVPTGGNSQWSSWKRLLGPTSELRRMIGNAGYLVHNPGTINYGWTIKGRPVPFSSQWTTTGLNFLGFPTPTNNPPVFDTFLAPAPALQRAAEIYFYPGGPLGTNNPQRLLTLNTTPVTRGQAVWMRAGTLYNDYYGPFTVTTPNARGVDFQDTIGQIRIRLSNRTATDRTVAVRLLTSEAAPVGQQAIAGVPTLLLRGAQNPADLTYASLPLTPGNPNPPTLTLKPKGVAGQDVELVIGLNRTAMGGNPGALFAGVLRFTDADGLAQWDVAVSATVSTSAGLWVGAAAVSQVGNYLITYQKDVTGKPQQDTNGAYIVLNRNVSLGAVAQPFPLRLILHTATNNQTVLLQRVFYGLRQATNLVVSTTESVLDPATLASARRISAGHLPTTTNNVTWPVAGNLAARTNLSVTVSLPYDAYASNPFLHAYHPDHDNLDPTFKTQLPQGFESYRIDRKLTLTITAPPGDFNGLTRGTTSLSGDYEETLTLGGRQGVQPENRVVQARGTFTLNRISTIGTLTTQ